MEKFGDKKKTKEHRDLKTVWRAKVARYLAYCVDGGLLQSKFTINTLISLTQKVNEGAKEAILHKEIHYLLHLRPKDKLWKSNGPSLAQ